jgi:hypothetical protein
VTLVETLELDIFYKTLLAASFALTSVQLYGLLCHTNI